MSTRSLIAMQDGQKYRSIYCHWDGYPSHNGAILQAHYTDPVKLKALIDLGDISVLDAEIGEKHPFDARPEGVVTAYHRDRGEDDCEARSYVSVAALNLAASKCGAEYLYLYQEGRWEYAPINRQYMAGKWVLQPIHLQPLADCPDTQPVSS